VHILELGNKGYLKDGGGAPACTQSKAEARKFNTKKQGERLLSRLNKKNPDILSDGAKIIPATL
jgi:hypothetical protein